MEESIHVKPNRPIQGCSHRLLGVPGNTCNPFQVLCIALTWAKDCSEGQVYETALVMEGKRTKIS